MSTESERDKAEDTTEREAVLAVAKQLGEQFDAVVILASRHDGRGTRTISKGSGNWHTRLGIAREFIVATEEQIRQETIEIYKNL